jgi:hypothetical protein
VVGAHGKGALASALLGSFSHALAHAAPVPVTIVKAGEGARAARWLPAAAQSRPGELGAH